MIIIVLIQVINGVQLQVIVIVYVQVISAVLLQVIIANILYIKAF